MPNQPLDGLPVLHIALLHADDKDRPVTIFTLSIHPDGTRLATGGLDTKIKIWSTPPVLDEVVEKDQEVPKLLCTMTSHSGVVMCVRWSTAGKYLASGSDDNIVMIWTLETGRGGKVWGSTESNVENWKAVKRLVGHDSDVAGVAWSADDAYLASVGLDSTVLVWSGHNFDLVRRLDGHEGFVKGVVFDPVGQYLATQSDDNSVKIWRTQDWGLEADNRAPFKDSPKTNLSRLTWSPEGTHIVTPNSMNGPVFVAAVIERRNWESNNSMVGHENVVEVAAFNPLIFLRDPKGSATGANLCTLLALSARSSISLWITSHSEPIVVLDEVFDRDVLDLSWSADGTQLWSCSSEGHVAVFSFSLTEFSAVAPPGTREAYHATYNFHPRPSLSVSRGLPLGSQASGSSIGGSQAGTMARPNILAARKGPGAKRVVPKAAPPPQTGAFGGLAQQQKQQHFQPPLQPQAGNAFASTSAGTNSAWGGVLPAPAPAPSPRKRKAAALTSADVDDGDDMDLRLDPSVRLSGAPYRGKGRTLGEGRVRPLREEHELRELRPLYVPREVERTFAITNREGVDGRREVRVLAVPVVMSFGKLGVEDSDDKDTFEWRNFAEGDRKGTAEVAVVTATKTLWVDYLPQYVVCAAGSPQLAAVSTEDGSLVVYSPTGRRLLPTMVLDSPCSFLEAEGAFLMAITSLGSLTVWNTSLAKSLFPPLTLSSLLTSSATRATPHPTITTSALLPNGTPLISLSSGSTHSYNSNLSAWTRLSEPWWSAGSDFWEGRRGKANTTGRGVIRGIESAINDIVVDSAAALDLTDAMDEEDDTAGGAARKKATIPQGEESEMVGDQEMFRNAVSLGHLEVRMKAAVALDSPAEYRVFLTAYAKKLAEEGFRGKAEELVRELLGPIYHKPGKEETWSPTVVGLNKRDLLKEVLSVFAKSRMIATLGTEYQDILKKMSAA